MLTVYMSTTYDWMPNVRRRREGRMNTELFSVDRRGFYKVGGTLDLSTENPLGYSLLSVENFIAPEKTKELTCKSFSQMGFLFMAGTS